MKKLGITVLILVFGIGAVALAMSDTYVSGTWRYKITISIETPEGVKTGSAIREVSNSISSFGIDLPDVGNPAKVRGEAVVIDLGERGLLFGLISDRSDDELYEAFPSKAGATTVEGIKHFNALPIGKKSFIMNNIPTLMRFKDIDDPTSAEIVYYQHYQKTTDNFKEIFGDGFKLKDVKIEIVDEPLSNNTEGIIPVFDEDFWEWRKTLKFNDKRKITDSNLRRGAVK